MFHFQLFALETMRDRYWHNMAGRIQRAWRNYMRYKHECARRIQRFWKANKENIEFAKTRDYGHQLLGVRTIWPGVVLRCIPWIWSTTNV